jgi:hypothetical protein
MKSLNLTKNSTDKHINTSDTHKKTKDELIKKSESF